MAHAYKELFEKVNRDRKARGLQTLSWKSFITKKDDPLVKTYRQKLAAHVEPDPPKKIQRPPTDYNNVSGRESIFKKYGV